MLAAPGKRGRAVALSGMGLSVATVAGVPAAQALGQQFGWRSAFVLVAVIGVAALIALWFAVPHMNRMPATRPLEELGALATPQVWFTVAIGTVGFGGMFAVYTYITWTMTEVGGFAENLMWLVLMAYGVGMVVGTYLGGWVSDRVGDMGLLWTLIAMAVALVAFYFSAPYGWLAVLNFGVIGMLGSTLVPNLQTRLMDVAGRAQTLAAALNQAALNMANAGGAALGGAVIAAGLGYRAPALAGAVLALAAIVVWAPAAWLRARALRSGAEREKAVLRASE